MSSDPLIEGDRAPGVIALTATILSISSTAVFLRLYTRIYVLRAFGRDDFALTVAWVRNVPLLSCPVFWCPRWALLPTWYPTG